MYHAVVRLIARRTFQDLSSGRIDRFMSRFDPQAVFCFAGQHALGGEVRGSAAIRAVFERMHRLLPGFEVEPVSMIVTGWPWKTLMGTRLVVRAQLPDGSAYRNAGMQYLHLRWGKVVEDRLYEDTAALDRALQVLADHGVDEALAEPLGAPVSPGSSPSTAGGR